MPFPFLPTLFRPSNLGLTTGATILAGSALLLHPSTSSFARRRALLLDSSPSLSSSSGDWSFSRYQRDAKTPVVSRGRLNPDAVKQISFGSVTGVIAGLAIATFSRTLALLLGVFIFGISVLESRGIHVVPYKRIQRFLTGGDRGWDVRSAVQDNAAFKISFGAAFALAGFAEF